MSEEQVIKKCKESHKVNGVIPQTHNIEFDGMTCECGKFLYYKELCGCPGNPKYDLHSKPNPNYIPS